ncbi:hypothetical protein BOTBODRAFT_26959 [Botryobasidium botryosum FD-172 SS1]|uniref:Methyltransferase domain-containing protein n=1 Tax=Botryobasidium botryosum (strain FD-172 SS1) TaxID=930990 RepID=A0A067NB05_BOTB1|nr:hypothetical protein BOTBODRAFT_26959 [Botryobasidium botryosum FD-172 SS1]
MNRKKYYPTILSRPATSQGIVPAIIPSPTSSADSAASSTGRSPSAFHVTLHEFPRPSRHTRPRSSSATFMHSLSVGHFAVSQSSFGERQHSQPPPAPSQGSSSHLPRHSTTNLSRSSTRNAASRHPSVSSTMRPQIAFPSPSDTSTAAVEDSQLGDGVGKKSPRPPGSYFVRKNGKKHHAFDGTAPYPVSYERRVLDHDVWDTCGSQQISPAQVTWHRFDTPPANVLDLGTGTGAWVIQAAHLWPSTKFVGFDLVPIQSDPKYISGDFASRIRWVHGNFLEKLPFSDDHFDFVHIRNIARGVPEDQWGEVFEEIYRVMKPGAYLEMVEEDLLFPFGEPPSPSGRGQVEDHSTSSVASTSTPRSDHNESSSGLERRRRTSSVRSHPPVVSNSHSDPRDHSDLYRWYLDMHDARFINLTPLSIIGSHITNQFATSRSSVPLQFLVPPRPRTTAGYKPLKGVVTGETILDRATDLDSNDKQYIDMDLSRVPTKLTGDSLMPNVGNAFMFDLSMLPLTLSSSVAHVLGCVEAIWEHILTRDPYANRDEFDALVERYEMDMRDRIGFGYPLEELLNWKVDRRDKSDERKAFEAELAKVEETDPPPTPHHKARVGRTLRVYRAWKP